MAEPASRESLSPAHRNLLIGQAAAGVVLNFPLNGAIAWFTAAPDVPMPLLARGPCVAFDTVGTSFFLPLVTCLVLTTLLRRGLRAGHVAALPREALPGPIRGLPANAFGRGALLGLLCALTLAPATVALLSYTGVSALSRPGMALFKAVYTAALGLWVTPLFGWRALSDRALGYDRP